VRLTGCDTKNFWIRGGPARVLQNSSGGRTGDNDTEAKMLAAETNRAVAAQKVLANGPQAAVIKMASSGVDHVSFAKRRLGWGVIRSARQRFPSRNRRSHRRGRFLCWRVYGYMQRKER